MCIDSAVAMMSEMKIGLRVKVQSICQLPMCLLCQQTLSNEAMKPSHLKYHFDSKHSNKKDKPLSYFLQLKASLENQKTMNTMFTEATVQENDGMIAPYNIALLAAKTGKSYTIGETLLRPVEV
ncbi:zinc finger BED domain-containing protein 5-like [Octopus bimaculoides]|uniref:zinc finger BED domain-containing protein 5-like n=1 Tax=Octopus bimaculoides TaxID=37653 RepID=UPI00071D358C|nr:zinc finger BED domain-containing protein 5-like [Octopus bimaculoides]|eukprot:XP_014784390.1 PREDICTED: zinc finger BED domain-containing protein 5-like [Octopus bimaculoides]